MFYLKHHGKKLPIEEDSVYTVCPDCGKEFQIDLAEAVIGGELDLYGLSVCCKQCSQEMKGSSSQKTENRKETKS